MLQQLAGLATPPTEQWLMKGVSLAAQSLPKAGVITACPAGTVSTTFKRWPTTPTYLKKDAAAATAPGRTTLSSVPPKT